MPEDELLAQGYLLACRTDEVPKMLPRKVELHGTPLLICQDEGAYFAVAEYCTHKHESMAYGLVHEGTITCPHHNFVFDLDTGRCHRRRCLPLETYPLHVVEERIFVRVPWQV